MKINFLNSIENCKSFMDELFLEIKNLEPLDFSKLNHENSALVVVDVVNGFINEGPMSCKTIGEIIPPIVELMKSAISKEMPIIAFADCHTNSSTEFLSFPKHCLENTSESELCDEIKNLGNYLLYKKNSTNGFHVKDFSVALGENPQTNTFIVTGDCTDICVLQFCLTLKSYFDEKNKPIKIIIPIDSVDTYDAPFHNSDFMNISAYKILKDSGVTFVSTITNK